MVNLPISEKLGFLSLTSPAEKVSSNISTDTGDFAKLIEVSISAESQVSEKAIPVTPIDLELRPEDLPSLRVDQALGTVRLDVGEIQNETAVNAAGTDEPTHDPPTVEAPLPTLDGQLETEVEEPVAADGAVISSPELEIAANETTATRAQDAPLSLSETEPSAVATDTSLPKADPSPDRRLPEDRVRGQLVQEVKSVPVAREQSAPDVASADPKETLPTRPVQLEQSINGPEIPAKLRDAPARPITPTMVDPPPVSVSEPNGPSDAFQGSVTPSPKAAPELTTEPDRPVPIVSDRISDLVDAPKPAAVSGNEIQKPLDQYVAPRVTPTSAPETERDGVVLGTGPKDVERTVDPAVASLGRQKPDAPAPVQMPLAPPPADRPSVQRPARAVVSSTEWMPADRSADTPAPASGSSQSSQTLTAPPESAIGTLSQPADPRFQTFAHVTELQGLVEGGDGSLDTLRPVDTPTKLETASTPQRTADLPRQAATQILDALRLAPGTVDLSLSPEELGRVSLSMQMQDDVLTVIVQADRPETADLIRRSVDMLLQEAQAEGFGTLSFGFGAGDTGADGQGGTNSEQSDDRIVSKPELHLEATRLALSQPHNEGGLDLRL